MSSESAESRAHPDKTRDVWELSIWDPLPICLQMFCLFSPGHVLVYMLFLPLAPRDPRPSVTVFNCLVLQVILSVQLLLFQSNFSQQNKDTSIIQREVMHEYDTKFVHPRLYPTVRDVSTQISDHDAAVEVGTPTVQLRRGFRTRPNPNYAKHIDPEGLSTPQVRNKRQSGLFTPHGSSGSRQPDTFASAVQTRPALAQRNTPGLTSPVKQNPPQTSMTSTATNTGVGGGVGGGGGGAYLGIFNHPKSPLKKNPSLGDLQFRSPRNNSEMARLEQYEAYREREASTSPIKNNIRKSAGAGTGTAPSYNSRASIPYERTQNYSNERYPSMWAGKWRDAGQ